MWYQRYRAYYHEIYYDKHGKEPSQWRIRGKQISKWLKKQEPSIRLDGWHHGSDRKKHFIQIMDEFVGNKMFEIQKNPSDWDKESSSSQDRQDDIASLLSYTENE